ncbi:MAG: SDR family NAD(P)-dependent oxidoreductase, partial [Flavobacteriaceae bacterium]|nr:SDR family NAD(P)-dependent oxidoreductase [Flavobacteriaceae bacterium]
METKNIIVTGTSRGIGFELVKFLSEQNHNVLALTRNREKIDPLQKTYKNIITLEVDITKEKDLKIVANFVQNKWKRVDVFIHNAGALIHKPFLKTTAKDFINIYKVNVFAVA